MVVFDKPAPRRKVKPDGLPPLTVMITAASQEAGKPEKPTEVADFVRKRWWPDVPTGVVGTQLWQLAKKRKLVNHGGSYGLNGTEY
jgi:hypothetical protein